MAKLSNLLLAFPEQIAIFRARTRKLVPTRVWTDMLGQAHDRAFAVAGAMKADLLADFSAAIDRAIAEGGTLEQFRADFDEIVAEHGWEFNGSRNWRSRVIYNTNLTTSYAAGRLAQLNDPELQRIKPFWLYQHDDSVTEPRPLHQSWHGTALPPDDPWWSAHYPPNDWGCQCYVVAVSQRDLDRLGFELSETAPDAGNDPDTGLPLGIGKGWNQQPGATSDLVQSVRDSHRDLPQPLRDGLDGDLDSLDG